MIHGVPPILQHQLRRRVINLLGMDLFMCVVAIKTFGPPGGASNYWLWTYFLCVCHFHPSTDFVYSKNLFCCRARSANRELSFFFPTFALHIHIWTYISDCRSAPMLTASRINLSPEKRLYGLVCIQTDLLILGYAIWILRINNFKQRVCKFI
jgi:hypothetical protein